MGSHTPSSKDLSQLLEGNAVMQGAYDPSRLKIVPHINMQHSTTV